MAKWMDSLGQIKSQYDQRVKVRARTAPAAPETNLLLDEVMPTNKVLRLADTALKPRKVARPARTEPKASTAKPKHTGITQAPHGGSLKADAGRIGGASTSPAKAAAAKANGARGGRPRKAVAP